MTDDIKTKVEEARKNLKKEQVTGEVVEPELVVSAEEASDTEEEKEKNQQ